MKQSFHVVLYCLLVLGLQHEIAIAEGKTYQQKQHGMTLQVSNIRWRARQEEKSWHSGIERREKVLAFESKLIGASAPQYPTGWAYYTNQPERKFHVESSWNASERYSFLRGIDPRQKKLVVDYEFWDPKAPTGANGIIKQDLEWKSIPAPQEVDKPIEINRGYFTTLGALVNLESVTLKKNPNYYVSTNKLVSVSMPEELLVFRLSYKVPPARYDLTLMPRIIENGIVDAVGNDLTKSVDIYTGFSFRSASPNVNWADDITSSFNVTLYRVPSPEAKTIDVKLAMEQSVPSLRQQKWYRHMTVNIDLQKVPLTPRVESSSLREVQLPNATFVIEDVIPEDKVSATYYSRFRFINKDASDKSEWMIRSVNATSPDEIKYSGSALSQFSFWKLDGVPLSQNETSRNIWFILYPDHPRKFEEKKLDVKISAQKVQKVGYRAEFKKVPIPAPGKNVVLNWRINQPNGGYIILRRIGWMPRTLSEKMQVEPIRKVFLGTTPPDLALVVEKKFDGEWWDAPSSPLYEFSDDAGRNLMYGNGWHEGDDPIWNSKPSQQGATVSTFRLLHPFPESKSLKIFFDEEKYIAVGKDTNIEIPSVVFPAFPKENLN